jgi:excisionase family DNA binding protein
MLTHLFPLRYSFSNMKPLPVREAAERLGVAPQRVRALIRAGRLPASRLGRAWVVEPIDPNWESSPRRPGRPLRAANAWALLAVLSGSSPDWVDRAVRSRLRKRARDRRWVEAALRFSEPRSVVHKWRVLEPDLRRVSEEFPLLRSGLSAGDPRLDVVPVNDGIDAYVSEQVLSEIDARFHPLKSGDSPNLVLRVPSQEWVLRQDRAPVFVLAADLLDDADPRVSRAAHQVIKDLAS